VYKRRLAVLWERAGDGSFTFLDNFYLWLRFAWEETKTKIKTKTKTKVLKSM